MPFGHWSSFSDCVSDMKERQKYSQETAEKVCGKLKHKLEKSEGELDGLEGSTGNTGSPLMKEPTDEKISFAFHSINESERVIRGVATAEVEDKEKEIILMKAIRDALDGYMELPIVHYRHTERPVGIVRDYDIENGKFWIEVALKQKDADDVWEEIHKGDLTGFSIYGKRLDGNQECKKRPEERVQPCVTKSMRLWSVSIVGDEKINPESSFEVVKSYDETNRKEIKHVMNVPVFKWETAEKLFRVEKIIKEINFINKGTNMTDTVNEQSVPKEPVIAPKEPTEDIVKAAITPVMSKIDDIAKSFDSITKAVTEVSTRISELEKRIAKMEEEEIKKSQPPVVIATEPERPLTNAEALEKYLKRRR